MARKRSSKINIENYVNGSPITPGVTYKLGDADTHTAWLLASSSPCLFKLSATAPTDELWSNITPEQFIINGSVAGQVIEIASPNGKYFVVPTNAQDKNASVESAHATIALHPLGFDYDQEYQALPLDGDGPVSEGFYKISNLESGKLYSINVHPDLGGLMETKPNPEFSYALFSVGADNNPKAFLAGGKTTDQLVFVATETSAILSLGSTIEEAGYFVSIRNFSLGSGEGAGFDPASDQTISGAWSFTNTAGLVLGNEVPLVLGQGDDAVKIHGDGNGAAVIEGTNASHMDVAIPVKFQNPTTFDDGISFVATTGEKMKCILFGKESGPTRAILYEESNGFLSVTDPNNVNDKTLTIDGAGDLWVYRNENHNGVVTFNVQTRMHGTIDVGGVMTFRKTPNANSGINIPLAVGAATDTAAVNRLYAAGLAAVTDAFSVRCYPLLADCSSSNGTVFKTDREPNSLYFNVPPNSAFTVKCGLVTNARPMHNYSSIRGWVAPLRLPAVSTKFTARFGQMTTVARMGRDRDAFTLVPDQAAGGYKIGEIIDITFDHVRDADAGGYHIRVREIYYSNAEQKWKMKTTQALAPETSSNTGYPVCVYAVVYEQYQDGGYDTEDRGALWLLHGGNSSRGCVKIATVKGVHCFESIYPFSGYYLDMENTNSWALAGAFLPATMHLHCNNVNPAYYGFSSMESNIIVSEAVEDFVDPEAETITED